jgi:predicted ATP-dependent serine protease
MRTLTRTLSHGDAGGQALPQTLRALKDLQVDIRGSEIAMIAGVPGAGKSSLALYIAAKAQVPTLYICADTAAFTMTLRLAAMLTGRTQQEIERRISQPDGHEWVKGVLADASHVVWSFDSAPNLDDIDKEVQAFEEVMGINPALIVVDNLIDVADGGGDEWGTLRATMKELKFLARDTGAALLLLHHTSEGFNYDVAPPRSSLQGKVAQLPAVILTVHNDPTRSSMAIAAVKNRYGAADPSGKTAAYVWFDAARMSITDIDR